MEYQKITNLLGNILDKVPRFITKKRIEVHDQYGTAENRYKPRKQIRFQRSMLRSDLCDKSDAYIVAKGVVTVSAEERDRDEINRDLILKNNAPFISRISKINRVLIENAEDLDIVIPMYNFLEYSKNYSKTSSSLWNYYRDELTDETNDNNGPNKNVMNSKSFKYMVSTTGSTYNVPRRITDEDDNPANNPDYVANKRGIKEVEIAVSLRYLSNFWRALEMPLINCEVSLTLTWSKNCVITGLEKRRKGDTNNRNNSPTNAAFKITDCKLHVPVVTLSAEDDKKLLE